MADKRAVGIVEAVLFMENRPVDLATLKSATNLTREAILESLRALQKEYAKATHGLELIEVGRSHCFMPKREVWEDIKHRYGRKPDKKLSRAALETLAIIAYSQPVTRAEIESLRGVNADGMVRQLLDLKLIREVGKKDVPGHPIQYGTSREFLQRFNLRSIADLPKLDEVERQKFALHE
jgi:segregation and condensation protein B